MKGLVGGLGPWPPAATTQIRFWFTATSRWWNKEAVQACMAIGSALCACWPATISPTDSSSLIKKTKQVISNLAVMLLQEYSTGWSQVVEFKCQEIASRKRFAPWPSILGPWFLLATVEQQQQHQFNGPCPSLPGWAGTRKVKPIRIY